MRFFINFNELFDDFNRNFDEFDFDRDLNLDESKFDKKVEKYETDSHIVKKEIWSSIDGKSKFVRTYSTSKNRDFSSDIKELEEKLKLAVKNEEYEMAAKLRDEIKSLKE